MKRLPHLYKLSALSAPKVFHFEAGEKLLEAVIER
jgi:hypothetical protein